MKRIFLVVLAISFFATSAWAAKTTYIVTNHRMNYVKLKEAKGREIEERQMTHPATIDEQGLRLALASVKLSRGYLIKKEVDTQSVFDDTAIDFLAPALVKAFAGAKANEEVVFSYLSKNPMFIIRNDRINICNVWVHDNELHVKFQKLYAKVFGDTDKRGGEDRAVAQAQGLRVKLELGEGQMMGVSDPDEVVLNMNFNYAKKPEPKPEPVAVTMAGEKMPAEGEASSGVAVDAGKGKKGKVAKKSPEAEAAPAAPAPPTPKERLESLEQLKKDKLINKKEYEEKRKEILKEL